MIRIIENSWRARIAAKFLKADNMAITFGKSIFLHNASSKQIFENKYWLRHELKHVEQYQRYGWIKFLALYLFYSIKYGYYDNPLEKEAREAENDAFIIHSFIPHYPL